MPMLLDSDAGSAEPGMLVDDPIFGAPSEAHPSAGQTPFPYAVGTDSESGSVAGSGSDSVAEKATSGVVSLN